MSNEDEQALNKSVVDGVKEIKRLQAIERRFNAMLPLFEEARDAITVISLASARLHRLDLTLAARMDSVGIVEEWEKLDAASGAPK